jgi:surfactin synthase thioesterase subunit
VRDCKRLILETPYYDFPSVVSQYLPIYPLSWILHYNLPTHKYLQRAACPVSAFQGTDDWIVTYSNAKKLMTCLEKKDEFITIKGGSHNDLYQFPETVHKLDSLLAL